MLAGGVTVRSDAELVEALGDVVGRQHVLAAADDQKPFLVDRRGRCPRPCRGLVKPAGTEQVAAVVRICAEEGVPVVP